MIDVKQTIISQYANSPTIVQLIEDMNDYIDPQTNFDDFYNYVWNVETAQGFGLDILGKIVGVTRFLTVPDDTLEFFGFSEGLSYFPFDQAPFYDGQATTFTYSFDDTSYRTLILIKALANISDCTAHSINVLLKKLFVGRGRCYVNDLGGMRMRYTFEFPLTTNELAILTQSGAVPRPAAVESSILQVYPLTTLGFAEAGGQPFGQGVFFN